MATVRDENAVLKEQAAKLQTECGRFQQFLLGLSLRPELSRPSGQTNAAKSS